MSVVVVTGGYGPAKSELARALAERLGWFAISFEAIEDDLAAGAADTPRHWLRDDAELEMVRLLEAADGDAVLDVELAAPDEAERVAALLEPWLADTVELRCGLPGERPQPLGAPRTVVVDTTRPVLLGDIVSAVRAETGTVRTVGRG